MLLSEFLQAVVDRPAFRDVHVVIDDDIQLTRAVHDSRQAAPGALFCCVVGSLHDGHDHAADAVASGASALLCERPLGLGVAEIIVSSVRAAMGPAAAALAGWPSQDLEVIGVTGTNGKTTVVQLLSAIFPDAGVIGTLTGARTTPEAPELQALLADMVVAGRRRVAMEVSSHALDLHRVDGSRFRAAVFTNLSQDHLDHHGDMARYFDAKARLFRPERTECAVVNLDDPHGRLLRDAAQVPTVGYSLDDVTDLDLRADGSSFRWRGTQIDIHLPGRFNVSNAIAAATTAAELGADVATIAAGLSSLAGVPGRFERIDEGQDFLAAVDYAHTPDGLEQLLGAGRELARNGRVIVVFGAGGHRDASKRPFMGEVAARLADVVIVTSDNPRDEDPATIIAQVHAGIEDLTTDVRIEPDRGSAIAAAVAEARRGDVLLVAGKGHETGQTVGDVTTPFDDRVVLADLLGKMNS